jgi:hypothetical protein
MRSNTMNCEEYRQSVAADPSFDGGADHLSTCEACRAFRAEIQALDDKIARALEISVPALNLPKLPIDDADNPAADNVVSLPVRKPFARPAWYALAASVMLAVVIGVRMFGAGASYESLADEVLAHLDHEPYSLRPSATPVSDRRLGAVVPADVASMDHSAGLITYAQSCVINGKTVPHLVIQGERGPVTILLMPEEGISAAVPLDGENTHGVILPVGDGSIAIIGAREEKLERIEKSVLNSVRWNT